MTFSFNWHVVNEIIFYHISPPIKSSISLHFIFFSVLTSCWLHLPFHPPWLSLVTASFISLLPPVWRWGIQRSSVCVSVQAGVCGITLTAWLTLHQTCNHEGVPSCLHPLKCARYTMTAGNTNFQPRPLIIYRNNWTLEHEELRDANIQLQSLSACRPVSLEHTHPSHTHTPRLVKCNLGNWNGKSLINYIQGHKLCLPPSTYSR